jgi:hypothetical protein
MDFVVTPSQRKKNMCAPASFVLTKDRAFWSVKTDSHEDIIEEFGLCADGVQGPNIVRVEIHPPDDDFLKPLDTWRFQVDQDLLPDWWDAQEGEARARLALKDWAAARVFTEGEHTVTEGTYWAYGSATVRAQGLATVHAYGSATVIAYGSATVRAYNSVTVKECTDYAIVRHWADTEPCVPTGPNALVVDYRNGTMRVISNAQ